MKNLIVKSFITTLLLSHLAFVESVLASSTASTNATDVQNAEPQEYERIQVTGQLPASYYRRMLHKAEDNFFDLFNTLSNKEEFQVTCERRTKHAFTRLRERVCEAKFVSMIDAGNVELSKTMQSSRRSLVTNNLSRTKKYKEMAQKHAAYMVELINTNEKLRTEYLKLAEAKEKLEKAKGRG